MTKVWVWKSHEFASPDFTVAFQLFFTRILAIFNFEFLLPPLRHLQKTVHFSLTVAICLIQIPLRSEHLLCPLSTVLALNTGPCTWNCSPWINNLGAEIISHFFPLFLSYLLQQLSFPPPRSILLGRVGGIFHGSIP